MLILSETRKQADTVFSVLRLTTHDLTVCYFKRTNEISARKMTRQVLDVNDLGKLAKYSQVKLQSSCTLACCNKFLLTHNTW